MVGRRFVLWALFRTAFRTCAWSTAGASLCWILGASTAHARSAAPSADWTALDCINAIQSHQALPAGFCWYVLKNPNELVMPGELRPIDDAFRASPQAGPNTDWVYVLIYKPELNVKYTSPWALGASIQWGNFGNFFSLLDGSIEIGHFEYAWSCSARKGAGGKALPAVSGATGQTGDGSLTGTAMIMDGGGMTPMFLDYTDGYLEAPGEIAERFAAGTKNIVMLALPVAPDDCRKVDGFVKANLASGAPRHFSMMADPKKFEGAVCCSSAKATLEHLAPIKTLFDSYALQIDVPEKFMGQPSHIPDYVKFPPQLQDEHFAHVELSSFNDQINDWRTTYAGEKTYRYRTFDFQAFKRDHENGFKTCRNAWCQQAVIRQTVTSLGGHSIEAMVLR